jgi:hypothetical protein
MVIIKADRKAKDISGKFQFHNVTTKYLQLNKLRN